MKIRLEFWKEQNIIKIMKYSYITLIINKKYLKKKTIFALYFKKKFTQKECKIRTTSRTYKQKMYIVKNFAQALQILHVSCLRGSRHLESQVMLLTSILSKGSLIWKGSKNESVNKKAGTPKKADSK